MNMETLENIKQFYSLGQEFKDDFGARQNLTGITEDRLKNNEPDLQGKHFYLLKITKTPTRINYHQFSFEKLQDISRRLINGMTTFGTIPNRVFFKKYFLGGVRTISINQDTPDQYPSFTLNYLFYSNLDNLDVKIKPQLFVRIKMIDPTLDLSLTYLGSYDKLQLDTHLEYSTKVDYNSETIVKLGEKNLEDIFNNQFQRPRFFGKLFKTTLI